MSELAEYIEISVEAVGGPDSDAGKEMRRLLLAREGIAEQEAVTVTPVEPQPAKKVDVLDDQLESVFAGIFMNPNETIQ